MKPALVALALSSALSLACASPFPRPPAGADPASPQAAEAPVPRPSDTLTSDPPPAENARMNDSPLEPQPESDADTRDGGAKLESAADGGTPMPAGHHHHGGNP
jgi:hypothetical protein